MSATTRAMSPSVPALPSAAPVRHRRWSDVGAFVAPTGALRAGGGLRPDAGTRAMPAGGYAVAGKAVTGNAVPVPGPVRRPPVRLV